jgi:hypothetical protein
MILKKRTVSESPKNADTRKTTVSGRLQIHIAVAYIDSIFLSNP